MYSNSKLKKITDFSHDIDKNKIKTNNFLPLVEKYRPKDIDDLLLSDITKFKINHILQDNIIPNLIVVGPSGTGKTSFINILLKLLLNRNPESVISLNPVDNRGLEIINNTIIYFCKKKLVDKDNNIIPKFIIIDETDNITKKAQNIISKLIEEFSNSTRFIFTCNDSSKIIESIQSRCIIISLQLLPINQISDHLENICKLENISFNRDGLEMIVSNCKNDIRASINLLEAINNGFNHISCENISKISFQPNSDKILNIIKECASRNIINSIKLINELKKEGYCGTDILLAMINILKQVSIDENIRIKYVDIILQSYNKVIDGLDTNLQLYGCISKMVLIN
jgi:replication factor C subunit 2/4